MSGVSTGYVPQGAPCKQDDGTGQIVPDITVLFSPDSPPDSVTSVKSIPVMAGQAVLIEAYNMPDDMPIYVNRIIKASYPPYTGVTCPPCAMPYVQGPDGYTVFKERMTLGSENCWTLIKSNSESECASRLQLIITVPGLYELELSSVEMLGSLQVQYIRWELGLTPNMPSLYYAGVCMPNRLYCGGVE